MYQNQKRKVVGKLCRRPTGLYKATLFEIRYNLCFAHSRKHIVQRIGSDHLLFAHKPLFFTRRQGIKELNMCCQNYTSIKYDVAKASVIAECKDGSVDLFKLVPMMLVEDMESKNLEPDEWVKHLDLAGYKCVHLNTPPYV